MMSFDSERNNPYVEKSKREVMIMNRINQFRQTFCVIILSLIVINSSCYVFSTRPSEIPPEFPDPDQLTPLGDVDVEWSFLTLDGKEKRLKEFEKKVIFLTIWATWCGACRSEMPGVQRLYDSMQGENVAFVLLSKEDESTIRDFMHMNDYTFPVFRYTNRLPDALRTAAFPTTYIIDQYGSVVFSHIGVAKWNDLTTKNFLRGLQNRVRTYSE